MQQNTALIDDIMAALDAESSQNVELIVRNTQNGATKKMALASLEQIIYSYLTTAPVVTNLASVLGVPITGGVSDANSIISTGFYTNTTGTDYVERNFPDGYGILLHFNAKGYYPYVQIYIAQSGLHLWVRTKEPMGGPWYSWNKII